jgi:hypothetical protein
MGSALKPVTTTNSDVVMDEFAGETVGDHKPIDGCSDAEKQLEDRSSIPCDFVYSSKESARIRWKLDLILLPMV